MLRQISLVLLVVLACGGTEVARAQQTSGAASTSNAPAAGPPATLAADEPASPPAAATVGPIAATVNGEPIYVAEVEEPFRILQKAGRTGNEDPVRAKARLLSQVIDRKLVDQALLSDNALFTDEEVENQIKQLRDAAEKQGTTLEQAAAAQGVSIDKLKRDVSSRIATQRYMQKQLPTVIPDFIRQHKAEFDGTEIRASHILLRPSGYTDTLATLSARASTIREEITSGKIDFVSAARKYSNAPSRERGGDIGFVPRRGVMLEPFSAALFALKPGEVSQPVLTPQGAHLIQAGEVKPGTKDLEESKAQIQQMAAAEVLKQLISDQKSRAKIEYTGAMPYFKPGTEELVTP